MTVLLTYLILLAKFNIFFVPGEDLDSSTLIFAAQIERGLPESQPISTKIS